jgi:uncharacterized membrane protein YbhN (UPF0104 family)
MVGSGRSSKRSSASRTSLLGASGSFFLPSTSGHALVALLLGCACSVLVPAATSAAWRSVLDSCGEQLTFREAWGCYGVGCLANTVLPGRMGEAVRVASFARRSSHRRSRWLACGVSATIGLGQSVVFAAVLTAGAVSGLFPVWAAALSLALPAGGVLAGALAVRRRGDGRIASLATAATLAPKAWARALGWVAVSGAGRLLTAVAVLQALSVPHPVAGAFVAIGARAVGGAVPFAPGGAGVGAAAMAIGLSRTGVDTGTALAVAVSFHTLETAASVLFGATGWLLLRLNRRVAERPLTLATAAAS